MNTSYYFNAPAQMFEEAFPIGNGKTGAMVYGATEKEHISLNSDTVWSGHYERSIPPKEAYENWTEAVKQSLEGNYQQVEELLTSGFVQDNTQKYLPVGNLCLQFDHDVVDNYKRTLDLEKGIADVTYTYDNKGYRRTCFVSAEKDCIAVHISCSEPAAVNLLVSVETPLWLLEKKAENGLLELYGMCPYDYERSADLKLERYLYSQKEGDSIRYSVCVKPVIKNGQCLVEDGQICIRDSDEVTLFVAIRTSFIDSYSAPIRECRQRAKKAVLNCGNYEEVLERHEQDFSELFGRVKFSVSQNEVDMDHKERMMKFDGSDKGLYELLFHFGRYLMISGSLPGSRAMNLQGIWNELLFPPWRSNYTVNINTEMNYWPAFSCNLAECFEPFAALVKEMVSSGRCTAEDYYHAKGFVCHHNLDLWSHTAPVGVRNKNMSMFTKFSPWPLGSAWLGEQLFDGYEYTLDKEYLKEIYPVMKDAAEFYLDVMVEENGKLILTPSSSPENCFAVDGSVYALAKYASMSQAMIEELYRHVIEASCILDVDEEFRRQVESAHARLKLPEIGSDGRLLEWDQEYEEVEKEHRHVSHLYALYPGTLISMDDTPELAQACKKTLLSRGDDGTGWSLSWKINFWAFLRDGEKAEKLLKRQLKYVESDAEMNYQNGGGTYLNLFDAHPPFQIDGNFGASAGIANMLLQSTRGQIHLLPALPKDWDEGNFEGLVAKGNVTVSAWWKHGKVYRMVLCSKTDQMIQVRINGSIENIFLKATEPYEWQASLSV